MTGVEKINLNITSDTKETLKIAFQKLRRTPFVVEDTLTFDEVATSLSSTMTITTPLMKRARALKLNDFLFLSVNLTLTAGGAPSNVITLTVPYTFPSTGDQSVPGYVFGGAVTAIGLVRAVAGSNRLEIYQDNLTNYTLGAISIEFNGFFEVL